MKKLLTAIIAFLLIWNVGLSLEVANLKTELEDKTTVVPKEPTTTTNDTPTQEVQVTSQISSDTTKVIQEVKNSVVTVRTSSNINLVGTGSGVIYNVQGNITYIITNHHVVSGGNKIEVAYLSGEVLEASLIGSDQFADLALLKVENGPEVKPFKIGDSSLLTVGEIALAIGSPAGENFAGSVTQGIVSGVDRTLAVDTDRDGLVDWDMVLIQTDAAINPGNSGGALVNIKGELIGVNTTKITGQAYEGMGFAIPVNEVVSIINQIQNTGEVYRPQLGIRFISLSDLNEAQRYYYSYNTRLRLPLDENEGLFVTEVIENTASWNAGLKSGDIILEINNKKIENLRQFRRILYSFDKGSTIELLVKREKTTSRITIQLQ